MDVITGEFPPESGGVADYTAQVAAGLAAAGLEVHVWCGRQGLNDCQSGGVWVHRCLGTFDAAGFRRLSRGLDACPSPKRLLVQYVPHAFGCKAMNVRFILWLWWRHLMFGNQIDVMFHELAFPFVRRPLKHNLIAIVNRLMLFVLLLIVRRAYISTEAWRPMIARYSLGRVEPKCCPVPSNVHVIDDHSRIQALRAQFAAVASAEFLGHLGTYPPSITKLLKPVVQELLERRPRLHLLLLGRNSAQFRETLLAVQPDWLSRIIAREDLPVEELSLYLQVCDVLFQPYPDGATTRRTSLMSGLSHGIATVTTQGVSTEAIWQDEVITPVVAVGDIRGQLRWLTDLLENPDLRQEWGRRGQQYYDTHFSLEHTLEVLLEDTAKKACDVAR